MLIVNTQDWLDENGDLLMEPHRLRRNALRVAQLIEYGGPLRVGEMRETLVACSKRPSRNPCPGLLWVAKEQDERIYAYCIACGRDETLISGWQETLWAEGMMEAVPVAFDDGDDLPTRH